VASVARYDPYVARKPCLRTILRAM